MFLLPVRWARNTQGTAGRALRKASSKHEYLVKECGAESLLCLEIAVSSTQKPIVMRFGCL